MTETEQAIITHLLQVGNCVRAMSFIPESIDKQWIRGHMLASSYRGCDDKNNWRRSIRRLLLGNSPQGRTAFGQGRGDAEKADIG